MGKPARRDPAKERFWRQKLRQWQTSGLGVRAFCRLHDLAEPQFYAWRGTIAERDQEAGPAGNASRGDDSLPVFVPVKRIPPTNSVCSAAGGSPIEVVLGSGRVVRVPVGFDGGTLRQILAIVEESAEDPSC